MLCRRFNVGRPHRGYKVAESVLLRHLVLIINTWPSALASKTVKLGMPGLSSSYCKPCVRSHMAAAIGTPPRTTCITFRGLRPLASAEAPPGCFPQQMWLHSLTYGESGLMPLQAHLWHGRPRLCLRHQSSGLQAKLLLWGSPQQGCIPEGRRVWRVGRGALQLVPLQLGLQGHLQTGATSSEQGRTVTAAADSCQARLPTSQCRLLLRARCNLQYAASGCYIVSA